MTDPALTTAVEMIAEFEGFRAEPYQDIAGIWTIGFGTIYLQDGSRVTAHTPAVTRAAEEARLQDSVAKTIATVRVMTSTPLTANQAAACASLAYNVGTGALRRSTLMALVGRGNFAAAAGQFGVWIYAGGRMSQGLVRRRKAEAELFLRPDEPFTADLSAQNVAPSESDALNEAEIAKLGMAV